VIGGIYLGVFTPTEAAGIGAAGALLITWARRTLTWRLFFQILVETGRTTGMVFAVVIGAVVFSNMINMTQTPLLLTDWITAQGFSPLLVILVIVGIYLVLGCVMESMSMILLTVPVFYPIIAALDLSFMMSPEMVLIWF